MAKPTAYNETCLQHDVTMAKTMNPSSQYASLTQCWRAPLACPCPCASPSHQASARQPLGSHLEEAAKTTQARDIKARTKGLLAQKSICPHHTMRLNLNKQHAVAWKGEAVRKSPYSTVHKSQLLLTVVHAVVADTAQPRFP